MRRARAIVILVGVALIVGAAAAILTRSQASPSNGRYYSKAFTFGADSYRYLVYVPDGYRPRRASALIVVLHGCQTTALQQAAVSEYAPIAQRRRLIVLYPEVDPSDAANGGCWKGIWEPGNEGVGRGDAGAIAAMTRVVMRTWRIDPSRVYLIGISAGAYETSILGATYPDLYAAIGIHSGAAYMDGLSCVLEGRAALPTAALARAAHSAMGAHPRVVPVIVIHGDRDTRVPYRCGRQALAQWLATDTLVLAREHRAALPTRPTATRTGGGPHIHSYTVDSYAERGGCPVAQMWTVHGMGHAWSGGTRDSGLARYSDPLGPSAAAASVDFFLRWTLSGACQPPTS